MSKLPPPVLAESWMPIEIIGAETTREKSLGLNTFPPHTRLHVWWARRPLTVSRAALLAGVLPLWNKQWPAELLEQFPTENSYRQWFLKLLGIHGDPVVGRKTIQYAKDHNLKLKGNPYTHARAFTVNPPQDYLKTLGDLLEYAWGTRELSVLDPFAGGGSIPFEALRYGFTTLANELNPVAAVILKATLEYPARYGVSLSSDIAKWGAIWAKRIEERLKPYFPKGEGESIFCYLWARTVACPATGKPVPLSPNWWLVKGGKDPLCVKLHAPADAETCRFEIVRGAEAVRRANPDEGTVKGGVGRSPWTGDAIDGDYIKAEAQAGRMGEQLYAIGVKTNKGFHFRPPSDEDLAAAAAAREELARRLPDWETQGLVPHDPIPEGNKTSEPHRYGMKRWSSMFSPRQLLSQCTALEELRTLEPEIRAALDADRADAVITYLGLAFDKSCDYNSLLVKWDGTRNKISNTFDRHDFSFKWSHGEFDAAGNLFPWVTNQAVDAYTGIATMAEGAHNLLAGRNNAIRLSKGSATALTFVPDGSLHHICTDPPYYQNVMYAECSDFFYVWQKRSLGRLYPDWFADELTNKDDEAVANAARFTGNKKKADLARADYERKMAAAFREMQRVLRPDGVLTVMFTHKEVAAWDTLAMALIEAGFVIKTSWPVQTESDHSLHQAKKNAAKSTILLVCRKRDAAPEEATWWDDIKGEVRATARAKAREFHALGISGVDLYISTFGPVLAILSRHWPVLSSQTDAAGEPIPLRPEIALDLAREEVIALRKEELLHGRPVKFDPLTDWYLVAWDAFGAEQFAADEARKLAIVLGLDLEKDIIRESRVVSKKSSDVVLQQPQQRRKKGMVDPDLDMFPSFLDAVHTAMLVFGEDGARACEVFLKRTGFLSDAGFKAALAAMIAAIPRTRQKGAFVRPEAKTLEELRLQFFPDIEAPAEEEVKLPETQIGLYAEGDEAEEAGENDEEMEE